MYFLGSLVSLCLLAFAKSKITANAPFNITVTHEDSVQFNISSLFDMSKASFPVCDVKQSAAQFYNYTTAVVTKDLSIYAFGDEPEIANIVSNSTVYAIYDNNVILIQQVNLDHQTFGNLTVAQFGRPGISAVCTDLELNENFTRVYVACFNNVTFVDQKVIYLVEFNSTDGSVISTNVHNMSDEGKEYNHRLQVRLTTLPDQQGILQQYVIVYDQGITGAYSTKNQWVWILSGATQGNLTSHGVREIANGTFNILYDIFPYANGLILTGKVGARDQSAITLAVCSIDTHDTWDTSCTIHGPTPFGTKYGYVGVMNTGQFIEVNTDPLNTEDDLHICDFGGQPLTPAFINLASCQTYLSYRTYDNVSISNVEGNGHMVVVKYCHFDSTYAGYSLHQFDLRYEDNQYDNSSAAHLIPLGRTLVNITRTNMSLYRQVEPYILVKASDLADGNNSIRVDCTDKDN